MIIEVQLRNSEPFSATDTWGIAMFNPESMIYAVGVTRTPSSLKIDENGKQTVIEGTPYSFVDCLLPTRDHIYLNLTFVEFKELINGKTELSSD